MLAAAQRGLARSGAVRRGDRGARIRTGRGSPRHRWPGPGPCCPRSDRPMPSRWPRRPGSTSRLPPTTPTRPPPSSSVPTGAPSGSRRHCGPAPRTAPRPRPPSPRSGPRWDGSARSIGATATGVSGDAPLAADVGTISGNDLLQHHPHRDDRAGPAAGHRAAQPGGPALPGGQRGPLLSGLARVGRPDLRGHRRAGRHQLRAPLLHVHLHHGPGPGLQHPGHDPDPRGGPPCAHQGGRPPRRRGHRHHRDLGRPHPGRDLRRAHRHRQHPGAGDRPGPGRRDPPRHLLRPHAPRPVRRRAPRPVELVAVQALRRGPQPDPVLPDDDSPLDGCEGVESLVRPLAGVAN